MQFLTTQNLAAFIYVHHLTNILSSEGSKYNETLTNIRSSIQGPIH